ncbi:MAG: ATP-binding protein [Deltaproteobacteria bacterium]|nr:ATP-binding protein [Deltaproteobacteria bacterium]
MHKRLEFQRILEMTIPKNPIKGSGAAFLWGPRGTGKTTYLKQKFPRAKYYDLLQSDLATELMLHPDRMRKEILAERPAAVVIDEIQKVPPLMDEVHWLLENTATLIILCGSSARKLKRGGKNLLGGRAVGYQLFPLTTAEIKNIDLQKALQFGTNPRHYLEGNPRPLLKAYVSNYLREEIIEEALTRNIPAFARFLEVVALTHGQLLNYANVGREVGVSPSTVRDYYQILEDTLIGHTVEPWRKRKDRRLIETAKFYLFDVGIANALHPEAKDVVEGTDVYGNAFEHFFVEELRAYLSYKERDDRLAFWRTTSGYEVDVIIGSMAVALEFKSTKRISTDHLRGLRALREEHTVGKAILVSREERIQQTPDGILLMPWQQFCDRLWDGEII